MPRQKLGPAVYSTKPFYSFKSQPLDLFLQILKKRGGGKASHHSALMLIHLLGPGVDLEEGRVGHMLLMRWAGSPGPG